jgi:hypothetical protein
MGSKPPFQPDPSGDRFRPLIVRTLMRVAENAELSGSWDWLLSKFV